ncbi:LysR family transcriptional regulator [Pelagicoccus sp. SDUM812003]|uniref:LysR family transcriptional regulator n=1 Tax=Pelagicoccus sp. SDUM812003 TaxID=3041267 RepID=UPI00280DBC71|nr:LysR family transcriptional regulator [Pelagicoccus sp. SDUM812003]MDQ8201861.1 LysR family transcriptional regulator [Pelagicoccus sp. SDUM812003]
MELQQLRYFVAVSKHRNFTRAAEECRVSQPALSMQIQKLEGALGGPLFHRQGRKIVLTGLGERLLSKAENLLLLHQSAIDELRDEVVSGGVAQFGATLTIAPYLIPYVVSHADRDDIPPFRMEENFTEGLLDRILDGSLDFALMSTPVEIASLMVKVVAREPFVLVMPSDHRLSRKGKISMDDALKEPFLPLSQIHCAGRQISEFYSKRENQPRSQFESAQIDTILKLVGKGLGVTLLPKMAVLGSLDESLCYRYIHGVKLDREISMVHHPDRYLSDSARKMMTLIETCLNDFVKE